MKSIASCVSTVVSTCASTCAIGIGAALLAGCAGPSGSMPQFLAATTPPAAAPGEGTRPPDSRSLGLTRSERLQTAKFVEGLSAYRTDHDGGAPILRNAKIRGPIDRAASGQGEQTYYCVSAEIGDSRPPVIPFGGPSAQLTSLELVRSRRGRKSGFRANTIINQPTPPECQGAFEPFPELEQVREERRAAMGMSAATR